MMTTEELKYKESRLRTCFMEKLEKLDVDGANDMCCVKEIKTYGALWHYVHQLCMAEGVENESGGLANGVTIADKMDIQATGLKMRSK